MSIFAVSSVLISLGLIFFQKSASAAVTGGNDFSNATELSEGISQVGPFEVDTENYFFVNVQNGYELQVDYSIIGEFVGDVTLFSEEEQELAGWDSETATLRWLNSKSNSVDNKIYIVIENSFDVVNCDLTISFVERFDANSGNDVPGSYSEALLINKGEFSGYLSYFVFGETGGNDEEDYYKLDVKAGDEISIKFTPEGKNVVGFGVYNSNRDELYLDEGLDRTAGEISQKSFIVEDTGILYIVAKWPYFNPNEDNIIKYTMQISSGLSDDDAVTIGTDSEDENLISDLTNGESTLKTSSTRGILIIFFIILLVVLVLIFIIALIAVLSKKSKKETKKDTGKNVDSPSKEPKVEPQMPVKLPETIATSTPVVPAPSPVPQQQAQQSSTDPHKVEVTVHEGTEVAVKTVPEKK